MTFFADAISGGVRASPPLYSHLPTHANALSPACRGEREMPRSLFPPALATAGAAAGGALRSPPKRPA